MRVSSLAVFLGFCGVVVGHSHHHQDGGKQVPLHEQEFVQDGPEELERKWSFEVSLSLEFSLGKSPSKVFQ
jgi:agmatinase